MSRKSKEADRAGKGYVIGAGAAASAMDAAVRTDFRHPVEWWRRDWLWALFLVIVTMLAYLPAWNGTPIWDDNAHLTKPELRSLEGLARIWTQPSNTTLWCTLFSGWNTGSGEIGPRDTIC
jgi:hypothetical protein